MTQPDQPPANPSPASPGDTAPPAPVRRQHSFWTALLLVSLAALIAVTSFGAGILAERDLFAVGLVGRAREFGGLGEIGGLTTDARPDAAAAFPRLAEVKRLIEEEYYYRPVSDDDLPAFRAGLDRAAVAGMATAAAEPPTSPPAATPPGVASSAVATPAASPVAAATPATPAATPVAAAAPVEDVDAYLRRLEEGALIALTQGLPDDYTEYFPPAEQAPIAQDLRGQYEGIGVWVRRPEGRFVIVGPIPGSPAEEAGLLPGDEIEAADGTPLRGLPESEALELIRGPVGSTVRLTIRRPDQPRPLEIDVERRAVTIPSVQYELVGDGRLAHIWITIFSEQTTQQLDEALRRAKADGVQGIVLDLRGNGGGWVTSAREAVGRFVPADRGPALYEDVDPAENGELKSEPIVGGGEEVFDLPLVVLVDGGTASASEIVAGALRDYGRARLVGERTFGKGLVQRVHDFPDGSSVRITSAQWLTPNQTPLTRSADGSTGGLTPDVVVSPPPPPAPDAPPPDPAALPDPQLDRAVDLLLNGG